MNRVVGRIWPQGLSLFVWLWITALIMYGRPPTLLAHAVMLGVLGFLSAYVDVARDRRKP